MVDDDARIAASIRRALVYEGYDVAEAHDGHSALTAVRDQVPDLVVLDVMLPGIDGLEVCRRMRDAGDDIAVLMLTAKTTVPDRVNGLDSGADDYLVKPFAHEELLARVRALLRRKSPAGREILSFDDVRVDVDAMDVTRSGDPVDLTALEFRLLEYLVRNQRIVLSRARILEAVWGLDVDTTSNIVDVYIRYLRQKLGEPSIIQTVRSVGYVVKSG
ncbi:MAG: response regulator transcription factor [Acidimicrobiia bacterium]|nr:response regulator transcription factor [Acidimicrobiia bacterium]